MAYNFVRASSQYISSSFSGIPVYPVTFSAWAYATNDAAPSAMNVVRWMQEATTLGFSIVFAGQTAGDPIRGNLNTATASISQISPGFVINTWYHVCFVCNSSTSRTIYKDGVAGPTVTADNTPTDLTRLWIGSDGGGNNFDGYISDIAVWSVALNTREINSLAKGFSAKRIRPQSLEYHAPLVRNLYEYSTNTALTNNNTATVTTHNRIYS